MKTSIKTSIKTILIFLGILIFIFMCVNSFNKPKVLLIVNSSEKSIDDKDEYGKVINIIDNNMKNVSDVTKSLMDKFQEEIYKNGKCLEIVYPYPKLKIIKRSEADQRSSITIYSKVLIPLDKNYHGNELFIGKKDYESGGLDFGEMKFEFLKNK